MIYKKNDLLPQDSNFKTWNIENITTQILIQIIRRLVQGKSKGQQQVS